MGLAVRSIREAERFGSSQIRGQVFDTGSETAKIWSSLTTQNQEVPVLGLQAPNLCLFPASKRKNLDCSRTF